jgi:hypothetical protein
MNPLTGPNAIQKADYDKMSKMTGFRAPPVACFASLTAVPENNVSAHSVARQGRRELVYQLSILQT